jgi:hypothetical protein
MYIHTYNVSGSMDKLDDKALVMGKNLNMLGRNLTKVLRDKQSGALSCMCVCMYVCIYVCVYIC